MLKEDFNKFNLIFSMNDGIMNKYLQALHNL